MINKTKILIIDDDRSFSSILSLNLEAAGNHQVEIVNNPDNAINRALNFKPDLILLDIIMPSKEGPDVAIKLHSYKSLKDVPIVYLTSTVSFEELENVNSNRAGHTFVSKPCPIEHLNNVIEEKLLAQC